MSHDWSRLVYERGPENRGARAVLLALAFMADRDTGECWPKVATIGDRVGITERHTRRVLARLEDDGWIRRTGSGGRSMTSRYWILRERFSTGTENPDIRDRVSATETRTSVTETRTSVTENPDIRDRGKGTVRNRQEPSVNARDHLPGSLTSVGMTDDERTAIKAILTFMPSTGRPDLNRAVEDSLLAALRSGRSVDNVKAWLDSPEADLNWSVCGPGAVVRALRRLAATPPRSRVAPPRPGREHHDPELLPDTTEIVDALAARAEARAAVRAAVPPGMGKRTNGRAIRIGGVR